MSARSDIWFCWKDRKATLTRLKVQFNLTIVKTTRNGIQVRNYLLTFESGASAVNEPVDDALAGGEVSPPVQLEPVVHLLGVGAAVHVDHQRVPLALTEVRGQIQPDLQTEYLSDNYFLTD